jgi:hypothetical protein
MENRAHALVERVTPGVRVIFLIHRSILHSFSFAWTARLPHIKKAIRMVPHGLQRGCVPRTSEA